MQAFEIGEKPAAKHADLPARERNAMFRRKGCANFLPLPVTQETLHPDVNHDVVTYDAALRNQARKNPKSLLSPAAGNALTDRLSQPERAVLEGHAASFPGLLHSRRAVARRAALRGLLCINERARNTLRALAALLLQLPD